MSTSTSSIRPSQNRISTLVGKTGVRNEPNSSQESRWRINKRVGSRLPSSPGQFPPPLPLLVLRHGQVFISTDHVRLRLVKDLQQCFRLTRKIRSVGGLPLKQDDPGG